MNKEELISKIKNDLSWDRIMSVLSLVGFAIALLYFIYATLPLMYVGLAILNFLVWYNALLITKRNKQMMEVKK